MTDIAMTPYSPIASDLVLGEGLHRDIPMDRYVGDPCPEPSASKGTLHTILTRSPAHAREEHPRLNPTRPVEESSRADIGSAVHAEILGGQALAFAPPEFSDWRKKAAQEWRDEQRAAGKIPLLASMRGPVAAAADAAHGFLRRAAVLFVEDAITEGTMIWRDGQTWKRGRFDLWFPGVRAGVMIDIKTCESADPAAWIRSSMVGSGYDVQAQHYLQGLRALEGEDKRKYAEFFFLLVEFNPPYACSLVGLDPEFAALADRKLSIATTIWHECMTSGRWPGYSPYPHWAAPPPWMIADVERRMLTAEEAKRTVQA